MYYYIRGPLLAHRRQVESLVSYLNLPHCPLLPVAETEFPLPDLVTSQGRHHSIPLISIALDYCATVATV
jgi:hypothetical protein